MLKCIKKHKKISFLFAIIIFCIPIIIQRNIPVRTAIFRTFVQGNWFITSDKDTVYALGYYGIKKYTSDNQGNLKEQIENKNICKSSLVGFLVARSGIINENYIYVALRSYLTGNHTYNSKNYINGKLLVLQKNNLSIIKEIKSDIKYIDSKLYNNKLIISGIRGFDVYDVSEKANPKLIFKERGRFSEFQGFSIFEYKKTPFIVFSHFGNGISIWRLHKNGRVSFINNTAINNTTSKNSPLQCFNVITKYPYVYSTLAPKSTSFNSIDDKRGIIVFDISNFNKIKQSFVLIPKSDWYKKQIGDPEPSYIDIYDNFLFVNFGEKGIAKFNISNPQYPQYMGIKKVSINEKFIQPIHINHKGILFAGDFYWPKIYSIKVN